MRSAAACATMAEGTIVPVHSFAMTTERDTARWRIPVTPGSAQSRKPYTPYRANEGNGSSRTGFPRMGALGGSGRCRD